MKKYESPKVNFEVLKLEQPIANQCWSWANAPGDDSCYYDYSGKGWIRFSVDGGSCKGTSSISYKIVDMSTIPAKDQANALKEFSDWWMTTGSNGGSPFKGGANYSEVPPTNWS